MKKFKNDPNFRDHVLFYEYFHGGSGRGAGASRQTGETGLIAKLLMPKIAEAKNQAEKIMNESQEKMELKVVFN